MTKTDLERRLHGARDCEAAIAALAEYFSAHELVFGHGTDNASDEAFWLLRYLQRWRDDVDWSAPPEGGRPRNGPGGGGCRGGGGVQPPRGAGGRAGGGGAGAGGGGAERGAQGRGGGGGALPRRPLPAERRALPRDRLEPAVRLL